MIYESGCVLCLNHTKRLKYTTNFEMGRKCDTDGRKEMCMQGFGWETLEERDQLEDQGVGGRVILKWIFKKWFGFSGGNF